MNEQKREQISALVDNELTCEAVLVIDNLLRNNEAKEIWERYHLIGNSLRGHLPDRYENTADKVSSAIALEPMMFTQTLTARKKFPTLMKPMVGFAIAVAVVMVIIFNVQQAKQNLGIEPTIISQSHIVTGQSSLATSITSSRLGTQPKDPTPSYQSKNVDARLNRYLMNYNEYRANTGIGGMPPHVWMIASESEHHP